VTGGPQKIHEPPSPTSTPTNVFQCFMCYYNFFFNLSFFFPLQVSMQSLHIPKFRFNKEAISN